MRLTAWGAASVGALIAACGSDGTGFDGRSGREADAFPDDARATGTKAIADGATGIDAMSSTGGADASTGDTGASDSGTDSGGDADSGAIADAGLVDDPFDPTACTGTALKGSELLPRVSANGKGLGTAIIRYRSRECTSPGVGCGPFAEKETWVFRINANGQYVMTTVSAPLTLLPWPSPPTTVDLWMGPTYPGSTPLGGYTDHASCTISETATVSCGDFNIVFSAYGPSPVNGSLDFWYGTTPLRLTGKITANCLQLFGKGGGVAPPGGIATANAYVDEEVAVLNRWTPDL